MDIEHDILYYLVVYNGRSKPAIEAIKQDIIIKIPSEYQNKYLLSIPYSFTLLESKKKIRLVPYAEMTSEQKWDYDHDHRPIYEIINEN